jgi:L-fuculose-phosphate aldolase
MSQYYDYKLAVLQCAQWLSEHEFFGSVTGTGGNVSTRVTDKSIAITPSTIVYSELTPDDICIIDFDLNRIEGDLDPSVESAMHLGIYRKRPDVGAVVHTHQTFASVFALINKPIPALFDEITFNIGPVVDIIPYALSGTPELVKQVVSKLDNQCHCYVLQNHGALCLGQTIDKARLNAELLEKAARIYYYSLLSGDDIRILPDDIVSFISEVREALYFQKS